ncbi:hypothetical protein ciss_00360 [Carboxydothermus islandicus]|uniref:Uncharacterized protein n=1 Tax=Carboxydothermus islandicus TaxID=661089 RepID=A0A1L8CYX6_9THEO|nr:hypothetical protein ciss_00360 [Carboxydothermus islandicus]
MAVPPFNFKLKGYFFLPKNIKIYINIEGRGFECYILTPLAIFR